MRWSTFLAAGRGLSSMHKLSMLQNTLIQVLPENNLHSTSENALRHPLPNSVGCKQTRKNKKQNTHGNVHYPRNTRIEACTQAWQHAHMLCNMRGNSGTHTRQDHMHTESTPSTSIRIALTALKGQRHRNDACYCMHKLH